MSDAGPALRAARRLISGLVDRGLAGVVVSPGSRNAPLMQAIREAGLPPIVALDERAAAHHALGMALALERPVAVCCTSGTAALNHGPALAEAHQVGLPLLSLTADRPQGAADHWESQTLEQDGLHDRHVRASFQWSDGEDHAMLEGIAQALEAGPVHINCPFDEPLYPEVDTAPVNTAPTPSPAAKPSSAPPLSEAARQRFEAALEGQERILLLGGTQPTVLPTTAVAEWQRIGAIAGDSTSGLGIDGRSVVATDRWMRRWQASGIPWRDMKPDLVVGFGAPLLSKSLRHTLRAADVDHLHIDPGHRFPHAFGSAPVGLGLPVSPALDALAGLMNGHAPSDDVKAWQWRWRHLESKARAAHAPALEAAPWCDLSAHALLHDAMPMDWDLHLANSTPVRYAQLFHHPNRPTPWSNRGVAGIDGCSSTAVGSALAGRKTTLISGDLGFLYDANAFHVHPLPADLRVAVLHNGGGGVFRWLDGPDRTGLLESHFEMRHGLELRSLCDLHGLEHERVTDAEGLGLALADWWSPSEAPRVLEIATPPEVSAEAYKAYMAAVSV